MRETPDLKAVFSVFFVFVAILLVGLAAPRSDFVIVLAKPGTSERAMMQLISDAGGSFVSQGSRGWIAIAHAENSSFVTRLFAAGALLVLDHSLAAGCLERK